MKRNRFLTVFLSLPSKKGGERFGDLIEHGDIDVEERKARVTSNHGHPSNPELRNFFIKRNSQIKQGNLFFFDQMFIAKKKAVSINETTSGAKGLTIFVQFTTSFNPPSGPFQKKKSGLKYSLYIFFKG